MTSGGSNALVIANNGNVGIGTTNPQSILHVNGFARFVVPMFYAVATGTYSGNSLIALNTPTIDNIGGFVSATYRYQPNIAGYYVVTACLTINQAAAVLQTEIRKNTTVVSIANAYTANNYYPAATTSVLVYMNGSTDYVQAYITTTGTGTLFGYNYLMATYVSQ